MFKFEQLTPDQTLDFAGRAYYLNKVALSYMWVNYREGAIKKAKALINHGGLTFARDLAENSYNHHRSVFRQTAKLFYPNQDIDNWTFGEILFNFHKEEKFCIDYFESTKNLSESLLTFVFINFQISYEAGWRLKSN